jgi:hypothetical protein
MSPTTITASPTACDHSRTFSCRSSFLTRGRTKYKTQTFLNVDQIRSSRKQVGGSSSSGRVAGRKKLAGSRWQEAGSRKQVGGSRKKLAGSRWQEAGGRKQQQRAGSGQEERRKQKGGSRWQVAGSRKQEAGSKQVGSGWY